jgi:hypothetical protein
MIRVTFATLHRIHLISDRTHTIWDRVNDMIHVTLATSPRINAIVHRNHAFADHVHATADRTCDTISVNFATHPGIDEIFHRSHAIADRTIAFAGRPNAIGHRTNVILVCVECIRSPRRRVQPS